MLNFIKNLFKPKPKLTPTYEMFLQQALYQGEHSFHDGDWGKR